MFKVHNNNKIRLYIYGNHFIYNKIKLHLFSCYSSNMNYKIKTDKGSFFIYFYDSGLDKKNRFGSCVNYIIV